MIMMMSLPKMKISCLHPQVHLSSSSLLAATEVLPSLSIRNRTSYLVRLVMALVLGADAERAMALGPEAREHSPRSLSPSSNSSRTNSPPFSS
ncbi:unnamed protein product [Brassica rapa]|uniref:Uncharacterized protein n=1 Tax=Brassica campestris TaxID=3711 RepID=A0A8D9GWF5_BRACM|nr:unnamed protein product [Brassica rapa]